MVDFCRCRIRCPDHYFSNGEFPGSKGGDSQPGEFVAHRIKKFIVSWIIIDGSKKDNKRERVSVYIDTL